jgi:flagellar basal body P-ring formation protein FlgA
MNAVFRLFFLLITVLSVQRVHAEQTYRVKIRGREESTVTQSIILLGDVVDFESEGSAEDTAVIALKRIRIKNSPPPGKTLALKAQDILNVLRSKGVDFSNVGYSLPQEIHITRAGRELSKYDLRKIIEDHLELTGQKTELKSLKPHQSLVIFPGEVTYEVKERSSSYLGRMSFTVTARNTEGEEVSIDVTSRVDEFREVPVASRGLGRGQIVGPADITMARLNIDALPNSVIPNPEDIIGLEASRTIGTGDLFHRGHLKVPPMVEKGATVKILFKSSTLEASALGEALEDGLDGEVVRVRNVSSRKIIKAKVTESGVVRVSR